MGTHLENKRNMTVKLSLKFTQKFLKNTFLLFIFQVVFYSSYCLDIYVCSENYIKVRDAAISLFNQGKPMEEIQPIPFIKNFLLRYVDEAALQRRQSQAAEDDNPPSPTMVGGTFSVEG